jgi:hypothetical protein
MSHTNWPGRLGADHRVREHRVQGGLPTQCASPVLLMGARPKLRGFAARPLGLASGLVLAVRPTGSVEAPRAGWVPKMLSAERILRSDQKGSSGALARGGADPDNARRSGAW